MKAIILLFISVLTSTILVAQVPYKNVSHSTTYDEDNSFGDLITETPFGAKLYIARNLPPRELIDHIKNSFSGKAIFIDFWALWCTPCIEQMPHSKRMSIETKELPVEFIYFCNSSHTYQANWKSKILTWEQPGIHIFIDDAAASEIQQLFSMGGYPGYVFINKKGEYMKGAIPQNESTTTEVLKELIKK